MNKQAIHRLALSEYYRLLKAWQDRVACGACLDSDLDAMQIALPAALPFGVTVWGRG